MRTEDVWTTSSRLISVFLLSFPECASRPWAILDNRFAVENRPTHLTQYPLGWLSEYDFFPDHQDLENDSVSVFRICPHCGASASLSLLGTPCENLSLPAHTVFPGAANVDGNTQRLGQCCSC